MWNITLNNGRQMPIIGFGTFKVTDDAELHASLDVALGCGYRSFDTAAYYENETCLGKSLKELLPKHGLTREDVFITSKLGIKDHGTGKCRQACLQAMANLDVEYLDLYLVHYPCSNPFNPKDPSYPELRKQTWKDLESLYKEGKLRAIGVSNYVERHIEELLQYCEVKPAVLQVEFHPHLVQHHLLEYCRKKDIFFQAFSSLGQSVPDILTEPVVCKIAEKMAKTPAQVLLRWAVQQNIGCLPKSVKPHRIAENFAIFDFSLSEDDMKALTALNRNKRYTWLSYDPNEVQ